MQPEDQCETDVGEKIISEVVFDIHDDKQSANKQISCEDLFSVALNEPVLHLVCYLVFAIISMPVSLTVRPGGPAELGARLAPSFQASEEHDVSLRFHATKN